MRGRLMPRSDMGYHSLTTGTPPPLPPTSNTTFHDTDEVLPFVSVLVFSTITMATNMALILVILCVGNLKGRTSNKFVLNLMMANFFIGFAMFSFSATIIALNSTQHTFADHSDPPLSISLIFGVMILLSVTNMMLLTAERLYAVKWTFRYFGSVVRQVRCAIFVPWVLSGVYFVVLMLLLELGESSTTEDVRHVIYISFDIVALLGFIILTVSSAIIYKSAKSHIRRISQNSVIGENDKTSKRYKERILKYREARLAVINVSLVVKFVVFWSPALLTTTYHLIYETTLTQFIEYLSLHLVLINCICDPTVYVMLSRDIRHRILFRRKDEKLLVVRKNNFLGRPKNFHHMVSTTEMSNV